MTLEINKEHKLACYWFTQDDLQNKQLMTSLIPEQRDWNKKGYRVCEFHSGTDDIVRLTKELLIHNKRILFQEG